MHMSTIEDINYFKVAKVKLKHLFIMIMLQLTNSSSKTTVFHRVGPGLLRSDGGNWLLNSVGHEHQVSKVGHQGISWSHWNKSQEHKGPYQGGSVRPWLLETDNDVTALKLLFSVLQESNKAFFGAFWEYTLRNLHIQVAFHEESIPGNLQAVSQADLEAQVRGTLCKHQGVGIVQLILGVDRGLCWNPHTAALCH